MFCITCDNCGFEMCETTELQKEKQLLLITIRSSLALFLSSYHTESKKFSKKKV